MTPRELSLEPGALWRRLTERTQQALQSGALQPIPTACELVEQGGITFVVRILANLARKAQARQTQKRKAAAGQAVNPFLPYDPELFVADISPTHVCLLNKFNVVDHHLLIVTRAFEDQEMLLTWEDCAALAVCLREVDGLGFYNGGREAGASQPHKHLQLVPLPLAPLGPRLPIESLIAQAHHDGAVGSAPGLPFVHALVRLDDGWRLPLEEAAGLLLERYRLALQAVGLRGEAKAGGVWQSGPYNLLVTRQWLLLVPRSREDFQGISVNALGFAGALLVRDEEQRRRLKEAGPLTVLGQVGIVRGPS